MQFNLTSSPQPLFMQIAQAIEDAVFTGAFPEEMQIPSTTEISTQYQINPATVLKGINQLVDNGIIYKKRGVGMFVKEGAQAMIKAKRQSLFFREYVQKMLLEADKLGLSQKDLIKMIEKEYHK